MPVHAEGGTLTGTAEFVLDGASAELIVVAADDGDLYLVRGDGRAARRA